MELLTTRTSALLGTYAHAVQNPHASLCRAALSRLVFQTHVLCLSRLKKHITFRYSWPCSHRQFRECPLRGIRGYLIPPRTLFSPFNVSMVATPSVGFRNFSIFDRFSTSSSQLCDFTILYKHYPGEDEPKSHHGIIIQSSYVFFQSLAKCLHKIWPNTLLKLTQTCPPKEKNNPNSTLDVKEKEASALSNFSEVPQSAILASNEQLLPTKANAPSSINLLDNTTTKKSSSA